MDNMQQIFIFLLNSKGKIQTRQLWRKGKTNKSLGKIKWPADKIANLATFFKPLGHQSPFFFRCHSNQNGHILEYHYTILHLDKLQPIASKCHFFFWIGRVLKALTFHQCGPGSIPELSTKCGLNLWAQYSAL